MDNTIRAPFEQQGPDLVDRAEADILLGAGHECVDNSATTSGVN